MKGSSRGADIRGSIHTDIGAETEGARRISARSRALVLSEIGERTIEDRIKQRCAIAVGDLEMAKLLRFQHDPVTAGVQALGVEAPIVTDIRMVQAGILRKGHRSTILCALDYGGDLAEGEGITRTSAGFIALGRRIDGAILLIGNSPSALISVCELLERGRTPSLVIGVPVGFVNAAESKELLRSKGVPSISTEGTRGGTPVAVAAMNEIITIHMEHRSDEGQSR
ncbi:MAG: precorrin-8X methylmutase [Methanomicrobiales archaeon]|nr:precorrin-8X methylmutase [Methanomicrobiales archaeon]